MSEVLYVHQIFTDNNVTADYGRFSDIIVPFIPRNWQKLINCCLKFDEFCLDKLIPIKKKMYQTLTSAIHQKYTVKWYQFERKSLKFHRNNYFGIFRIFYVFLLLNLVQKPDVHSTFADSFLLQSKTHVCGDWRLNIKHITVQ